MRKCQRKGRVLLWVYGIAFLFCSFADFVCGVVVWMFYSYLEVLRRYRKEGKKPLRTIHLTWVPGKSHSHPL